MIVKSSVHLMVLVQFNGNADGYQKVTNVLESVKEV